MLRGKCYSLMRKPAPTIAVETGSPSKSHTQFVSSSVDSDQDAGARENRPFSALILVLKHREIFVWKSFGNRVTKQANAISSKPRLCPDRLDSPRIGARQEIFQRKGGMFQPSRAAREGLPEALSNDARFQQPTRGRPTRKLISSYPQLS